MSKPTGKDGASADRVDWIEARNLPTNDPRTASILMRATAHQSDRVQKPVYHLSISFDHGDPADHGTMSRVADRVIAELQALHSRYRMDEVFFLDDDLFASLKRIRELAEAFIAAKVPFTWKGTARADELCRLPEEVFERLRESGCKRNNIGAESGCS